MINNLIQWSLRNRLAVLLMAAILLASGIYSTLRMPIDVFPDLTAPTVTVIVEGHGMAPQEMETLVTFPIETAVNGAAHVRRVRSATAVGIAVVWVEFEWGTDIYRARQTVTERLATVSGTLPDQVKPPVLAPVSSIMGEILFISLTSDVHDSLQLRTAAKSQVRRRLLSVAGVSQVTPIGGDQKQYQVVLSTQRMRAYQISMEEVSQALRRGNENVSAGFLIQGGTESVLRGIGRVRNINDIADTEVASRGGRPITVGDVGVVQIGAAIKRGTGSVSMRGPNWEAITKDGVILAIQKQPAANTLELTQELDYVLDEIQKTLPEGMLINKQLFRQADFIEHSIHNTTTALIEGALMVLLVVVLFLASLRASLITLLAIPISLVSAFLVLRYSGASINTMTLGGMAIAIGALVDDAIIDVENVVRRLRENRELRPESRGNPLKIIFDASVEVRTSIVFATFIILLVFAPLFFLSGVEGRLLRPLGLAFCVSLAASLVTALTLTPALCFYLLPTSKTVSRSGEPWIVGTLKRVYARPLRWAMQYPMAVTLPSIAMLILAIFGINRMGKNFLPEFNEGALVVGLVTLPGTSLAESNQLARIVETTLMQHPEILAIGRRTGRAEEDEHVQGVEASEIDLTLDMEAPLRLGLKQRSKAELLVALRKDLAGIPGVQATFGQPIGHRIDHMLSGTRANIAIKIFGDDLATLRDLADQVEVQMSDIAGVVDLSSEQQVEVPQVRVEFRRDALARYGLHIAETATALNAAFRGGVVSQVLEGRNTYDLTVRLAHSAQASTDAVGQVLVDTPAGFKVPMKTLAHIYEDRGPNFITRENVQRKIVVMCNVADRDMEGVVNDARSAIEANVPLPRGYYVEFGGQFENAKATNQRLAVLGVLVILGIGFLLHIVFRSMRDALLIMVNLPLALIGGVAGAYIAGGVISIASIIGFISVFGIAARNGIMLVSHVRQLQAKEGVTDFAEAVRRGSMERLAPILMTALAAGMALIPLALRGADPGTEILTPMAIVILFGLLSSTLLNMLVLPALLVRFGRPIDAPENPKRLLKSTPHGATLGLVLCFWMVPACVQVEPEPDFDQARQLIQTSTGRTDVYNPYAPSLAASELDAILADGLTLDEALRLALIYNRELQAEFLEIGVAHADWVQSQLLSNPSLDLLLRLPTEKGRKMLEAILGVELLELWRIPVRKKAARHKLEATVLRIARRAGEQLADVRMAYFSAVAADELHAVALGNVQLAELSFSTVQSLHQAGAADAFDQSMARGPLLSAQLVLRTARIDVANARRELAKLLSLDRPVHDMPLIDPLPQKALAEIESEALVKKALGTRLDLRSISEAILALEMNVRLEERRAWGDIAVGPRVERPAGIGSKSVGPALGLTLPIFDQNQAQIAKASFKLEQMVKLNQAARIAIAQNVRTAVDRVNAASQNLVFFEQQLLPQAELSLELARQSYAAGRSKLLALIEVQRQLLEARRGHVALRLEAAASASELERVVGSVLAQVPATTATTGL
jgi:CzcA family heavy metal efflux pump